MNQVIKEYLSDTSQSCNENKLETDPQQPVTPTDVQDITFWNKLWNLQSNNGMMWFQGLSLQLKVSSLENRIFRNFWECDFRTDHIDFAYFQI